MDKRNFRRCDTKSSDTTSQKPPKAVFSPRTASPQQQAKSKTPLDTSSSSGSPKNSPNKNKTEIKEVKRNQDAELKKDRRTIRKEEIATKKSQRVTRKIDDKLHRHERSRSSSPKTS